MTRFVTATVLSAVGLLVFSDAAQARCCRRHRCCGATSCCAAGTCGAPACGAPACGAPAPATTVPQPDALPPAPSASLGMPERTIVMAPARQTYRSYSYDPADSAVPAASVYAPPVSAKATTTEPGFYRADFKARGLH